MKKGLVYIDYKFTSGKPIVVGDKDYKPKVGIKSKYAQTVVDNSYYGKISINKGNEIFPPGYINLDYSIKSLDREWKKHYIQDDFSTARFFLNALLNKMTQKIYEDHCYES